MRAVHRRSPSGSLPASEATSRSRAARSPLQHLDDHRHARDGRLGRRQLALERAADLGVVVERRVLARGPGVFRRARPGGHGHSPRGVGLLAVRELLARVLAGRRRVLGADPGRVRLHAHPLEPRQGAAQLGRAGIGQPLGVADPHVQVVDLGQPLPGGRLGVLRAAGLAGRRAELLVEGVLARGERSRVRVRLRALDALAQRVVRALRLTQRVRGGLRLVGRGRRHGAALVDANPGRSTGVGSGLGPGRRAGRSSGTAPLVAIGQASLDASVSAHRALRHDREPHRGRRDHDRRQLRRSPRFHRRRRNRRADVDDAGRRPTEHPFDTHRRRSAAGRLRSSHRPPPPAPRAPRSPPAPPATPRVRPGRATARAGPRAWPAGRPGAARAVSGGRASERRRPTPAFRCLSCRRPVPGDRAEPEHRRRPAPEGVSSTRSPARSRRRAQACASRSGPPAPRPRSRARPAGWIARVFDPGWTCRSIAG